jgi:hypothetical protein
VWLLFFFVFFVFFWREREKSSSQLKSLFIQFFGEKNKKTDLFSHQTRQKDIHLLDELRFINARNK